MSNTRQVLLFHIVSIFNLNLLFGFIYFRYESTYVTYLHLTMMCLVYSSPDYSRTIKLGLAAPAAAKTNFKTSISSLVALHNPDGVVLISIR